MSVRGSLIAVLACVALLAGCASGAHPSSSLLPATPLKSGKANVTFVINAPQQSSTESAHGVRPQYLSPATQSMTIDITSGGTTVVDETVGLTLSSSGCTSSLASIVCTLTVPLAACPSPPNDCYTASLTTYDQTGGTGNVLSSAQSIAFTVVSGQSNTVPLVLSGIPASTLVVPTDAWSTGSLTGGYDLLGQGAHNFLIESLDADGNVIVGSGAPTYTIGSPSGSLAVTLSTPLTSSPDAFTVTPPATFSSSTASFTVTPSFSGQSTDGCMQAGANCNPVTVTVDMAVIVYVANLNNSTVTYYDASGTEEGSFSAGLNSPTGIAYDSSNSLLYALNPSNNTVTAYDYNGHQQMLTGSFPGLYDPSGITYDPSNGYLYVTRYILADGEYTVAAYDQNGNQQTLTGSFPGLDAPNGIAYDPSNGFLYVTNYDNSTVTAYDQEGAQQTLTGSFPGLDAPIGITYDPSNGFLYVTNPGNGNGTVTAYNDEGAQQTLTGSFSGLNYPYSIAYDPGNGDLYVTNPGNGNGTVTAYNDEGAQQTLTGSFPGLNNPYGIAVVP